MKRSEKAKAGPKFRTRQLWIGMSDGEIYFYGSDNYYEGVLHADLFSSRAAARRCYQDVRKVVVRESGQRQRKGKRDVQR